MGRFGRFVVNAGFKGCVLTLLVGLAAFFAVRVDVRTGLWVYTVPILGGAVGLAYLFRHVLVDHVGATRTVMNALGFVAVVGVIVGRRWLPSDEAWFRMTLAGFIGVYMGCYFWLMSDERIVVRR